MNQSNKYTQINCNDRLDLFAQRLQELQDDMGIYLKLTAYKMAGEDDHTGIHLYADELRSVYIKELIHLDLKTGNYRHHYDKSE